MKVYEVKAKSQALYYSLRKLGMNHSSAMGCVVDFVLSASMPKIVPPKTARKVKSKKGGKAR